MLFCSAFLFFWRVVDHFGWNWSWHAPVPTTPPRAQLSLSSFHGGADNVGRRRLTQQPPHLSFGRFFAGSTFLICGLPDSFSWLSALSPAVAMDVREFALRSLQENSAHVRNSTARGGQRLFDVRSDNTNDSLTAWWESRGWGRRLGGWLWFHFCSGRCEHKPHTRNENVWLQSVLCACVQAAGLVNVYSSDDSQ